MKLLELYEALFQPICLPPEPGGKGQTHPDFARGAIRNQKVFSKTSTRSAAADMALLEAKSGNSEAPMIFFVDNLIAT